jgi:hypothetical protein
MLSKISIYDCGCVISRPKVSTCKTYGTRWKVFITSYTIRLKCRDCGRVHNFELRRNGVQTIQWMEVVDEEDELDEMVKE